MIGGVDLSEDQVNKLANVIEEYGRKQFELRINLEKKIDELEIELQREDRFDIGMKERRSVRKANNLIKDITSLYGDVIKLKVEYLLKAKDVLTREQRERLIRNLDFDLEGMVEEELPSYISLDLLALVLELDNDQIKKILKARTDMQIEELKIELKIDYSVIDLEEELLKYEERDPENINKIISKLVDLGTQLLENKVDHFLKAKDVLTVSQKQRLLHAMMMATESYY